jgi:hypothetical protein
MSQASRIRRWRANKREQGLKHVSVWLTPEEELRVKDLALQWRCSASQVVQHALAQISTSPPDNSSPTDTLRIRRLILAELAALGIAMPAVTSNPTVSMSVGPTETAPQNTSAKVTPAHTSKPESGHSLVTEAARQRKGRPRSELGQRIVTLLVAHPEGLSAEQMRGQLAPGKPIGDVLRGMERTGVVRVERSGKALRYFVARP